MNDELGQQLHDRATRCQKLSSGEQERLDAWYAALDRAEAVDLGLEGGNPEGDLPGRIYRPRTKQSFRSQGVPEPCNHD